MNKNWKASALYLFSMCVCGLTAEAQTQNPFASGPAAKPVAQAVAATVYDYTIALGGNAFITNPTASTSESISDAG